MRFISDGPSIPASLLRDVDAGRVVFFCGAGVSRARAKLPDFFGLLDRVAVTLGIDGECDFQTALHEIRSARSDLPFELQRTASADSLFSYLEQHYDRPEIEEAVAKALAPGDVDLSAHRNLIDLSRAGDGVPRIVTTNFDSLFEWAEPDMPCRIGPRVPDGTRHDPFTGLVKLHGSVNANGDGAVAPGFVLSSATFGEAYLAEGWAARFIRDVVRNHTVVFVGYAADDPPVRYLLEALKRSSDSAKLYAFQRREPHAEDKWASRNVEALLFDGFDGLWRTVDAWAAARRDPETYRQQVVQLARSEPPTLSDAERSQVADLVSTPDGARAWADAQPPLSPLWLRVFDAKERFATPEWDNDPYRQGPPSYDPHLELRLEDDPSPSSLGPGLREQRVPPERAWDAFAPDDDTPSQSHSFRGQPPRFGLGGRRYRLASWIARCAHDPVTLWWGARQGKLHPDLRSEIEHALERLPDVGPSEAPIAWHRLFEVQDRHRDIHRDGFYEFKNLLKRIGWGPEALRAFERYSLPRPVLQQRLSDCRPPGPGTSLRSLIEIELNAQAEFFSVEVPDAYRADVIRILRGNLEWLERNEPRRWLPHHWQMPSFHPQEDEYPLRGADDIGAAVRSFADQLARLQASDPIALRREVATWPVESVPFAKLRVWLLQQEFMDGDWATTIVADIPDDAFWSSYQRRDLLIGLANSLPRMATGAKDAILQRLLTGDPSDDGSSHYRAPTILARLGWLENEGIELPDAVRTPLERLRQQTPDWRPEYVAQAAVSLGTRGGWVKTDEDWSVLKGVPVEDVVRVASENTGPTAQVTRHTNPFRGFAREKPNDALEALRLANVPVADRMFAWEEMVLDDAWKEYPLAFQQSVLDELRDLAPELPRDVLMPLAWRLRDLLQENRDTDLFERNEALIDRMIERNALLLPESGMGSSTMRSDMDLLNRSLNSVTGVLARTLMADPAVPQRFDGSGLPPRWRTRAERLLLLPEPQNIFALTELGQDLAYLRAQDEAWTEANLLPALGNPRTMAALVVGARHKFPLEAFARFKSTLLGEAVASPDDRVLPDSTVGRELLRAWVASLNRDPPLLTDAELRNALSRADTDVRWQVLNTLSNWLRGESEIRETLRANAARFFDRVWPRLKRVRSTQLTEPILDAVAASGPHLPDVAKAAERHIVPLGRQGHMYRLDPSEDDGVRAHPHTMRELVLIALPENTSEWPWGAEEAIKALEAIERGEDDEDA